MLSKLLKEKGIKQSFVADQLGWSRSRMTKLLQRENITVKELADICNVIGVRPGDLLSNSAEMTGELTGILGKLKNLDGQTLSAVESIITSISDLVRQKGEEPILFAQNRGVVHDGPKWSEDFPVTPEDFAERDFDFPLELSAVEVEEYEAAAGSVGVGVPPEDAMAYVLSMRGVRDASHRVIKIRGNSMTPVLQDGWKVLVDTRKRLPRLGDLVAVYLMDEGSVVGYWDPRPDGNYLMKANAEHDPIKLPDDADAFFVIGTIQKVIDAPIARLSRWP